VKPLLVRTLIKLPPKLNADVLGPSEDVQTRPDATSRATRVPSQELLKNHRYEL